MVEWSWWLFKPYLKDQLVSFSALTLLVWSQPVKIVPDMTYNVFGGTLLSLNQSISEVSCSCNTYNDNFSAVAERY